MPSKKNLVIWLIVAMLGIFGVGVLPRVLTSDAVLTFIAWVSRSLCWALARPAVWTMERYGPWSIPVIVILYGALLRRVHSIAGSPFSGPLRNAYRRSPLPAIKERRRRARQERRRKAQEACAHQWRVQRYSLPVSYRVWCVKCEKLDESKSQEHLKDEQLRCDHVWEGVGYSSEYTTWSGKQCKRCQKLVASGSDEWGRNWQTW